MWTTALAVAVLGRSKWMLLMPRSVPATAEQPAKLASLDNLSDDHTMVDQAVEWLRARIAFRPALHAPAAAA